MNENIHIYCYLQKLCLYVIINLFHNSVETKYKGGTYLLCLAKCAYARTNVVQEKDTGMNQVC